jgi:pyridinium-3,5-biscarboxylic acid mononucleotide sulfurtransferase
VSAENSPSALTRLEQCLAAIGPVAVAVSGGVDSMTLAAVAHRLDGGSTMFHALSPAVPEQATARVKAYARQEGWQLQLVNAGEINDPRYVANPVNRCYFCKTNLYATICARTSLTVVSGTNTDDLGDYRPGLIAATEHHVRHPYVEAGISKAALRGIARDLGFADLQSLAAAPCLSSRVTTGITIDASLLPVINAAEEMLWERLRPLLPLEGVRCRIKPQQLTIELQSSVAIDPLADYALLAVKMVGDLFASQGQAQLASQVNVEAYQRGSAFLIETRSL